SRRKSLRAYEKIEIQAAFAKIFVSFKNLFPSKMSPVPFWKGMKFLKIQKILQNRPNSNFFANSTSMAFGLLIFLLRFVENIKAKTIDNKSLTINQNKIDDLQATLLGKIITPSDAQFSEICKIWNAMIVRKPAFVIQCQETSDVV